MTVLGRAQEKPEVLDWARSRRADFQAISKADVDALASAYLDPAKASRVIIHPAECRRRPAAVPPAARRHVGRPAQTRPKTSEALVPPKPKLLARATSTLFLDGGVRREVEPERGAGRVEVVEVDRRRDDARLDREDGRQGAERARRSQEVPGHRLDRAHAERLVPEPKTAAIAAASSPSPPGVEVACAET
jgi:hypothetical protein